MTKNDLFVGLGCTLLAIGLVMMFGIGILPFSIGALILYIDHD